MIEAITTANGGTQTALVYNYDKMGRVEDLWQCAPYNCGSSGIWHMAYGWDLAGDMTNYTNPAGFTVTRTIDSAQQVTSQTYGSNMAVSNITYEPWGAISTMCGGQGCTQSQETRLYNSRLQPVLMELGNSTSLAADYCLVYNYYSSQGTPSSCAMPSGGTGDNGDIQGMYRQDNQQSGYGHAFTYTYDGVNRLLTAVATGSPAYNLTYNYDQYGNGWCVGGSGGGVCPALNYNSSKNQLTSIGGASPVTITYDAAGNQLNDQYSVYQYDAEGRVKLSSLLASPLSQCPTTTTQGPWQCPVYNALGQRVEDDQSDGQGRPMQLYYPRDIFGDRTGIWDDHSIANWVGWDIYWSKVAGQRLNMGGSSAYIDHADAVGSTAMETDPAGGWQWDIVYFPWGQIWQQTGTRQSAVWGDLDWQVNDPLHPSATREYSSNVNRWMTPDPGGRSVVKLDNPQTWNMYAYVGNNPTTLNDPGGLQSNCATGPDGGGCSSNGDSFEEDSMHFSDGRYGLDQITDLGIGMAKGLLNMLISTVNLEMAADPEMQGPQLPEFQATNATQGAGMVGAAVGLLFVPGAGEEAAAGESVSVYMKADESYVGISNSIARRQMEHGEELNGLVKLNSRTRARGVEQAIIEQRGLAKNGGTLANKINSIARSNPIYEQAVQFGREVLRSIGFPSF